MELLSSRDDKTSVYDRDLETRTSQTGQRQFADPGNADIRINEHGRHSPTKSLFTRPLSASRGKVNYRGVSLVSLMLNTALCGKTVAEGYFARLSPVVLAVFRGPELMFCKCEVRQRGFIRHLQSARHLNAFVPIAMRGATLS